MSFEDDANKLIRKIQKVCARHDVLTTFLAVETIMEIVLEQLPDDDVRYQLMVRLIKVNLFLSAFDDVKPDASALELSALASISDNEILTVAILGKIKALVDFCVRHWDQNRKRKDLASLRRDYKVDATRTAPLLGKLGRKFDDQDLEQMFTVFTELTSDMVNSIEDADRRVIRRGRLTPVEG
jgi:hypothetical protein